MIEQVAGDEAMTAWERVYRFPLVAMVVALVLAFIAVGLAGLCGELIAGLFLDLDTNLVIDVIAVALLVIVYKFGVAHLGERPRDDLRGEGVLRWLGLGLVAGTVIFSAAVLVAALLGVYQIVGVGSLNGLLPALIASAIFPAISEEIIFRGILFRWIEEFGGSWVALLLTCAVFGTAHLLNPNASPVGAVGIALEGGVMFGGAYMLTRSLWLPIGLHAAWNFTQGEIFDIPVSGNDADGLVRARLAGDPLLTGNGFGLEASVIAMVVATLFGLWLLRLAIRKGEVIAPWWVRRRRHSKKAVGVDIDADPHFGTPLDAS